MSKREIVLSSLLAVLVVTLTAMAWWVFYGTGSSPSEVDAVDETGTYADSIIDENSIEDDVSVSDLVPGEVVTASPLVFTGDADASWFSRDGSFVVEMQDIDGNVLGTGTAEAQTALGSGDRLPFIATVTFVAPESADEGIVLLRKDNPDGNPGVGAEIGINVRFTEVDAGDEGNATANTDESQ